ncbi:Homeodomain transcriptional regulator [Arachis hypogaea]|uniref:Homeodomain transcriptional regulator n=1 Tax=Arachis hypogaea TaxID=3818 RepID=A0A6B9VDW5_ARAHY|nr:Homeodomain transcriptional regulator [Arachis hypogaea]
MVSIQHLRHLSGFSPVVSVVSPSIVTHGRVHPITPTNTALEPSDNTVIHEEEPSRFQRKRMNEEARIQRELEAHEKRARKEIEK